MYYSFEFTIKLYLISYSLSVIIINWTLIGGFINIGYDLWISIV